MGVAQWHCLRMSRSRRPWWGRILRFLCCDEKSENECSAIFGDESVHNCHIMNDVHQVVVEVRS